MNAEISNYFRHCIKPAFAFSAAVKFASCALRSVSAKVFPAGRHSHQPDPVRKLRCALLEGEDSAIQAAVSGQSQPASCSLTLAVGSFRFEAASDWLTPFSDIEMTVSVHRWNWLLRGLSDDPARMSRQQGLDLMRSWIRHCADRVDLQADAYSTGERIVNGSLFLLLTGPAEIPADVGAAFAAMARQVAENLEYYRAGQTGNHAFNNARALMFAGLLTQRPPTVDLAFAICEERLPKLVTCDGFMREGSSHYHFLFTRWVLEMLWLARRAEHRAFVQLLTPYASRLVQRCWFFLVRSEIDGSWQIPLIGDVSPDFPPDWLLGLPWSSLARSVYRPAELPAPPLHQGWSDLFGAPDDSAATSAVGGGDFPASGWLRVDHLPWTVFVRAESQDGSLQASHAHHDLGSFVLFHRGRQVLGDSGRLDYTSSSLGQYGRSALAHSTLLIDGLGATCDGPNWLADRYMAVKAGMRTFREADATLVTIRHDGFMRLSNDTILHERRLRLSSHSVQIEDRLEGANSHEVGVRFHFAPGVELHADPRQDWNLRDIALKFAPDRLLEVVARSGRMDPPHAGLYFPAYGRHRTCTTLDCSGTVSFPTTFAHTLFAES